jgi:hypothetical protein
MQYQALQRRPMVAVPPEYTALMGSEASIRKGWTTRGEEGREGWMSLADLYQADGTTHRKGRQLRCALTASARTESLQLRPRAGSGKAEDKMGKIAGQTGRLSRISIDLSQRSGQSEDVLEFYPGGLAYGHVQSEHLDLCLQKRAPRLPA